MPTIAIDYAFLGKSSGMEEGVLPILAVKDSKSKRVFSHLVPSKGTGHPYPVKALIRDVKTLGHCKFILKSDQELSIIDVKNEFIRLFGGEATADEELPEVIPEESPVGDHQANGSVV